MELKKILIIGGAGFIGSHTADYLYKQGHQIFILDVLHPKNHNGNWPDYMQHNNYELHRGNVLDKDLLLQLLKKVDVVYHLAAEMDLNPEFQRFMDVNVGSTALIYELIVKNQLSIQRVIVASSQFAYGEGIWNCKEHGSFTAATRSVEQMRKRQWHIVCPVCQKQGLYQHNDELLVPNPVNHYAISKYFQEQLSIRLGKLYQIPTVAMRYSIVHGSRQSLKNTYSGALRTFALSYKAGIPFATFEDNCSMRDFIAIDDVVAANALVMENDQANYSIFNVGSGQNYTVEQLAVFVANAFNAEAVFSPTIEFRVGDTRHAISNCNGLHQLGWKPLKAEADVVNDYIQWFNQQEVDIDNFIKVQKIIRENGTVLTA